MTIDEARLEEFINKFAGDFGAAMHASTVVHRRQARAVPGARRPRPDRRRRRSPTRRDATHASSRSGSTPSTSPATATTAPETGDVLAEPRAGRGPRRSEQPGVPRRRHDDRGLDRQGRGEDPRGVPHRRGPRLARAPPRPVPRHRAAVQARLRRPTSCPQWIPALDGVEREAAARAATVADLGCGHGASTILLAQAYPNSTIVGFDYHEASIDIARKRAAEAGVADRVRFEVASAQDFPGDRLRPRLHLRRAPRHGRPARRGPPHPRGARRRRHVAARRADGRRPPRGQREPRRPDLLRRVHVRSAPRRRRRSPAATPSATRCPKRRSPSSPPGPGSAASAAPPRPRSTGSSKPDRDAAHDDQNQKEGEHMAAIEINDFSKPDEVRSPDRHHRRGREARRRRDRPLHVPARLALVGAHQARRRHRVVPDRARRVPRVGHGWASRATTGAPARSRRAPSTGSLPGTTAGSSATSPSSSSSSRARRPTPSTETLDGARSRT